MSQKHTKFSNSILDKIKAEEIKPRPSWHFWVRNVAFWSIFILAAVIGGRAIGVMGRLLTDFDLPFILGAKGPLLPRIFTILPLFWISFFLLFLLLANYGLHHTKKGYKFSMTKLVGTNLLISILIGAGATVAGDGERFEEMVHKRMPYFNKLEENRQQAWMSPEEGRIAGTIVIIQDETILMLDDFQNRVWTVNYSNAEWRRRFELQEGIQVTIIGQQLPLQAPAVITPQETPETTEQTQSFTFIAEQIGPWHKVIKK